MARTQPYQPLILRLLHASQGFLAILGILTGYWLLNTWDPQFGGLPLPLAPESAIEWHEDIGGVFSGAIAIFIVYSLWAGRRRLIQPKSIKHLTNIGKPAWWYALHRITNTALLIFASLAVISGDDLGHNVLENGVFSDWGYTLHVLSWLGLLLGTFLHIVLSVKVGGVPLLLSIVSFKIRPKDHPRHWPLHLRTEWQRLQKRMADHLSTRK